MKRTVSIVGIGIVVLAALALPAPARAAESGLQKELDGFAQKLKGVMDENSADSIAVGEFTGPPFPPSSSGPGIQQLLIQSLKGQKVIVKEEAALFIKGEYFLIDDPKDKERDRYAIKLEATVRTKKGTKVGDFQAEIRSNDDIAKLMGVTSDLGKKSEADQGDRAEKLKYDIDKPGVFIVGSKVKASKEALYTVEVLVHGAPRQADNVKGQAFVPIKRGEIYTVRVFNPGPHDAAVSLTIDGLDVFTFSEVKNPKTGRPRYTHYVVGPGKHLDIKGWHCNNEHSASFQVVDFKNSALAKASAGTDAKLLRASPAIGTLTVCFHFAWTGDRPPAGAREGGGAATGFGPPVTFKLKEVKRTIGVLREVVTIRYRK
jgi:hypothetical protein